MTITTVQEVAKNRYKIYLDEQFAFVLYKGELSKFHIKEERELSQESYDRIINEVIIPRAKKRAVFILQKAIRTEHQLRMKLQESLYTETIVEIAIDYVTKFGYVNDSYYAKQFVSEKWKKKSKKEIYFALIQKGIDKELANEILLELYEEASEEEAIRTIIRKKNFNIADSNSSEKQKIYAQLMRKGFSYEKISKVLQVCQWNA